MKVFLNYENSQEADSVRATHPCIDLLILFIIYFPIDFIYYTWFNTGIYSHPKS